MSSCILNSVKIVQKKVFQSPPVWKFSTSCTKFIKEKQLADSKQEKKLEQWLDDPVVKDHGFLSKSENMFKFLQVEIEVTPAGIKKFVNEKMTNLKIRGQKFDSERNKILGPDLSLAFFIVHNGGKVKFKGKSEWVSFDNKNEENLPGRFIPNFVVEEIDLSDVKLFYEGLENFENIPRVKRAIFARSPFFDDWYLDRVAGLFPQLEYLDISDCPGVTERGLEALYRTSWLKTLIVTNHTKTAAFELTCMMLEDVVPGLQINILESKNK